MHKEQNIKDLLSKGSMTYRKDMGMAQEFSEGNMHAVCINILSKIYILEIVGAL